MPPFARSLAVRVESGGQGREGQDRKEVKTEVRGGTLSVLTVDSSDVRQYVVRGSRADVYEPEHWHE